MVDLAKGMLPYLKESHERVLPWAQPDAGVEEVAYAARMVRSRALRFERCAIVFPYILHHAPSPHWPDLSPSFRGGPQ